MTVASALQRHGFSAHPYSTSGVCSARDVMMDVTNVVFDGPFANGEDHERILREEGYVGCAVREHPIYEDSLVRTREVKIEKGIQFRLGNVDCNLFPDDERAGEQVDRLRAAFADLEEELARS